jgi:CheY-like chemotaxis protein
MTQEPRIGTVMTVDDQRVDQMLYERILMRSGLVDTVVACRSAQAALDHLLQPGNSPVDVIFLDINMPGMSGFEFLAEAEVLLGPGFDAHVVVMLTTSLDPEDRKRAARFRCVRQFLNKPLTVEMVQDVARDLSGHA